MSALRTGCGKVFRANFPTSIFSTFLVWVYRTSAFRKVCFATQIVGFRSRKSWAQTFTEISIVRHEMSEASIVCLFRSCLQISAKANGIQAVPECGADASLVTLTTPRQ